MGFRASGMQPLVRRAAATGAAASIRTPRTGLSAAYSAPMALDPDNARSVKEAADDAGVRAMALTTLASPVAANAEARMTAAVSRRLLPQIIWN